MVKIQSRRQRCLLASLLVQVNEVVPAERLADQLWEGSPPPTAATALQVHVSRLRQVLGYADRREQPLLVTQTPGYVIRVDPDDVDALRFERLVAAGRNALAADKPEEASGLLTQALGLWRGPAMEEFSDLLFAKTWAARLEQMRLAAIEDQMEALLSLGRHAQVVEDLERLVVDEPYRERFWAQLMLAQYRCGRQADALGAYQSVRQRLGEEFGILPSTELKHLEQSILLQRPELDWERSPEASFAVPSGSTSGARGRNDFVGRAREMAFLEGSLTAAVEGLGQLVLVSGEAGIGKTRVADELCFTARQMGALVVWGRCVDDAGAPPYWPWTRALRDWAGNAGPASVLAEAGSRGPELAPLLPELRALLPAPSNSLDPEPEQARFRLFDAMSGLLHRLALRHPVVLVLDDLHAADQPSLALLKFVARELDGARILVIGTFRDEEVVRGHPLSEALGDLAREPVTRRLTIGGLAPQDVARYLELTLGVAPGPLAEAVHAKTDGNPFFVGEIARLLATENGLDRPAGTGASTSSMWGHGIPPGVREVVRRRCHPLSEEAYQLLTLASAVGRDFRLPVLERAWDGPGMVSDLVDEAQRSGLVAEDPRSFGSYRFSHELVRATLYDQLSRSRRARHHRAIGAALEDLADVNGTDAGLISELAHHFFQAAAGDGDRAAAVRYAVAAAESATQALAYEEAVTQYERGLEVSRRDPDADLVIRCQLLLGLGAARWRAGEAQQARQTFLGAAELARSLPAPDLLAQAMVGFGGGRLRAWHATRGAFGDRPVELLEEALSALGDHDSELRVQLLGLLAEELYYEPDQQRRANLSLEAIAMARRTGGPGALAAALCSRCLAVWGPDDLLERAALAREIVELATSLGDRELMAFGHQYVFVTDAEQGDMEGAMAAFSAFETVVDDLHQPLYLWEARRYRAFLALLGGRFADAERLATEALEIGLGAEEPDAMAVFGAQLAIVRLEQGRVAEVEPAVRAFAEEFAESPVWRVAVAMIDAELGRNDDAREAFESFAINGFECLPRNFAWLAGMAMLAQVCAALDDGERAGVLYDLLEPFANRQVMTGDRHSWGAAAHYLGLLAATQGHLDVAVGRYEQALGLNAKWEARAWEAHTCWRYADVLRVRNGPGDHDLAAALGAKARATADQLGMARLLAKDRGSAAPAS